MYVFPFKELEKLLEKNGYSKSSYPVPLSNGEQIVDSELFIKWESLKSRAIDRFNSEQEKKGSSWRIPRP